MFKRPTTPGLVARSAEPEPTPEPAFRSGVTVDTEGASDGDFVQITDATELTAWRDALRPLGLSVAHVGGNLYQMHPDLFRVEVDTSP